MTEYEGRCSSIGLTFCVSMIGQWTEKERVSGGQSPVMLVTAPLPVYTFKIKHI